MNRRNSLFLIICLTFLLIEGCGRKQNYQKLDLPHAPYLVVLGIAQDAGYPQAGCYKAHCMRAWENHEFRRSATSFALIDPDSKQKWLFEASPDIKNQLYQLQNFAPDSAYQLAGIFLTHGHMGHYTGLMHLGREAMGAKDVPVYVMPRMETFLASNGPWSQLVALKNINLIKLRDSVSVTLAKNLEVMPFEVPHRDEFTETVGYKISAQSKQAIFIPDIDKWEKWNQSIYEVVKSVDLALLDATFYNSSELPGRDMSEIPHPFVEESRKVFSSLELTDRNKIHFIHFNHSNPLLIDNSEAHNNTKQEGYNIASEGQVIPL